MSQLNVTWIIFCYWFYLLGTDVKRMYLIKLTARVKFVKRQWLKWCVYRTTRANVQFAFHALKYKKGWIFLHCKIYSFRAIRRSKNLEENDCDRRKKKVFLMFSERNRNRNEVSAYFSVVSVYFSLFRLFGEL